MFICLSNPLNVHCEWEIAQIATKESEFEYKVQ